MTHNLYKHQSVCFSQKENRLIPFNPHQNVKFTEIICQCLNHWTWKLVFNASLTTHLPISCNAFKHFFFSSKTNPQTRKRKGRWRRKKGEKDKEKRGKEGRGKNKKRRKGGKEGKDEKEGREERKEGGLKR